MSISNDYGSTLFTTAATTGAGIVGAFIIVYIIFMLLALAASVLMIVAEWRIFSDNDKPGWYSLIPFLNNWTLFEIVDIAGWWIFVPFANIVFMYMSLYRIAIKYNKSTGFAVLTIFFPYVCLPILAFKKEEIKKESKKEKVKEKSETKNKDSKYCAKCGATMKKDAAFCPKCGEKTK